MGCLCLLYCVSFLSIFCWGNKLAFPCLCFVFFLIILVSLSNEQSLLMAFVFILFLVVGTFLTTSSLFVFFVIYEFSLYPVCTLILLFGYQPEKVKATYYLLLYTVVCSAPFLFFTVAASGNLVSGLASLPPLARTLVCLSFMVKSPMYTLHSWL